MISEQLLSQILGRRHSLFQEDRENARALLTEKIAGARILVIGGAGTIGSSFVKQLVPFRPGVLHVVDPAENNLVELVRDLRSSTLPVPEAFRTVSIAMGSLSFSHFMASEPPYDYVVNFSALKHVRVERDPFSLMRMLEVNLFALEGLLRLLAEQGKTRVFSVSSDKAVNPANLMGASKALMEQILYAYSDRVPYTTARFANVAFSDGSLLQGFCRRFEKGQPLSAPNDVRRYFISYEESGQLCLLACFLGDNRHIFVPKLDPDSDLKTFSQIAELYLLAQGFTPRLMASDEAARMAASQRNPGEKGWPCHFSGSDTSGEKPFEEFVGTRETVDYGRFKAVGTVTALPPHREESLAQTMAALEEIRGASSWRVEDMAKAIHLSVPELDHQVRSRNLDQKM